MTGYGEEKRRQKVHTLLSGLAPLLLLSAFPRVPTSSGGGRHTVIYR